MTDAASARTAEVIDFAVGKRARMTDQVRVPETIPMPEPPVVPEAVPTAYSIQQVTQTQFNTAIPSHVWTPEVLKDLHAKQHDISAKQIELDSKRTGFFNEQRVRESKFGWAAFALVAVIILTALYFIGAGSESQASMGTHLIAATIAFLGGYLAGNGASKN